jgi:hypothetical protein
MDDYNHKQVKYYTYADCVTIGSNIFVPSVKEFIAMFTVLGKKSRFTDSYSVSQFRTLIMDKNWPNAVHVL